MFYQWEGVFQWSHIRDDFPLELHYQPLRWYEHNRGFLPNNLPKLGNDFGLERFYVVEFPLESVLVVGVVLILASVSYNGAFKVSDVLGV